MRGCATTARRGLEREIAIVVAPAGDVVGRVNERIEKMIHRDEERLGVPRHGDAEDRGGSGRREQEERGGDIAPHFECDARRDGHGNDEAEIQHPLREEEIARFPLVRIAAAHAAIERRKPIHEAAGAQDGNENVRLATDRATQAQRASNIDGGEPQGTTLRGRFGSRFLGHEKACNTAFRARPVQFMAHCVSVGVRFPAAMSSPLRWLLPTRDSSRAREAEILAREFKLPLPLARLLVQRGFAQPEEAEPFLAPKLQRLGDPFALAGMHRAVERILAAVDARQRVVLYGDYDVDGVTSLALLGEILALYGVDAPCFLPSRMEEGYGLSREGVVRCLEQHQPQLLIAVDCGTNSVAEIAQLRAAGADVIVFDHHESDSSQPDAVVVNPKLGADNALRCLCSVGIVFKAAHALLKTRPRPGFDLKSALDLVALGTVADLVPLVGENRILVRRGLGQLAVSPRAGVQALRSVAGVAGETVRPADIGYRLGPRLNAAGRLGTAQAALELLRCRDPEQARVLAAELHAQNAERQEVERRTFVEATELVGEEQGAAIVVGARGWHPGVIGIVASRLLRAHCRPALVVAFDADGMGKGSGRSLDGLCLVSALGECAHLLEKFGGHAMAAGLTVREAQFPAFRDAFRAVARERLSDEQLLPTLHLDEELSLADITAEFGAALDRLEPFGMGNAQPLFFSRGVMPAAPPRSIKDKHLRLTLTQQNGSRRETGAIWFNAPPTLPPPPWDIAFRVEPNEWNGVTTWQLQMLGMRAMA